MRQLATIALCLLLAGLAAAAVREPAPARYRENPPPIGPPQFVVASFDGSGIAAGDGRRDASRMLAGASLALQ